jgi:hypothetical protein
MTFDLIFFLMSCVGIVYTSSGYLILLVDGFPLLISHNVRRWTSYIYETDGVDLTFLYSCPRMVIRIKGIIRESRFGAPEH